MYPLPGNGQAGTFIFPQIFRPFGQNATFLLAYTLPYTYTVRSKREMKLYHSRKDSNAGTYIHTYIHLYIYIYIYICRYQGVWCNGSRSPCILMQLMLDGVHPLSPERTLGYSSGLSC
jgi:hypothetical protein